MSCAVDFMSCVCVIDVSAGASLTWLRIDHSGPDPESLSILSCQQRIPDQVRDDGTIEQVSTRLVGAADQAEAHLIGALERPVLAPVPDGTGVLGVEETAPTPDTARAKKGTRRRSV